MTENEDGGDISVVDDDKCDDDGVDDDGDSDGNDDDAQSSMIGLPPLAVLVGSLMSRSLEGLNLNLQYITFFVTFASLVSASLIFFIGKQNKKLCISVLSGYKNKQPASKNVSIHIFFHWVV